LRIERAKERRKLERINATLHAV